MMTEPILLTKPNKPAMKPVEVHKKKVHVS